MFNILLDNKILCRHCKINGCSGVFRFVFKACVRLGSINVRGVPKVAHERLYYLKDIGFLYTNRQ